AVAYFSTAKLAFSTLDLGVEASPLWPPAGIALAALLLEGERVWLGALLGALLFARSLGVSWTLAWCVAISSTLEAVVGAVLLRRMRFNTSLKRLKDVLLLVVLGTWVSPLVGATFSTFVGYLYGSVNPLHWEENWWTLWLGDGMGVLVVTPLILIWRHSVWDFRWLNKGLNVENSHLTYSRLTYAVYRLLYPKESGLAELHLTSLPLYARQRLLLLQLFFNRAEAVACLTLLCAVSWGVFASKTGLGIAKYPIEYLPFPLVVWAALRFSQRGAVMATLIISWIAFWGAAQRVGPFVAKAGDIYQAALFLQGFMGVVTISALVLAASESERTSAVDLLKEREASLANAQRLAQLGNWDFYETYQGQFLPQQQLRWSDELYRLLGFDPQVVKPSWEAFFQVVHPADRERVGQAIRGALRENKPYCIDYRIVLSDGSERVVCEQSKINNRGISGTVQDITDRKQVEAQLGAAAERERLLAQMALRIRRSLNLDQILNTTVAEVRQFLGADRVFIGQIDSVFQEWDGGTVGRVEGSQNLQLSIIQPTTPLKGLVIAESVDSLYPSLRHLIIDDEASLKELRSLFQQNGVRVIEDTSKLKVSPRIAAHYARYQVKASLGVPIWLGDEFYGALIVNQCQQPRHWQSWEIDWLTSLATQVAIAIQQAQLYQQITDLAAHRESQVEERTQELSAKMNELQELNQLKDVFLQGVSHDLRTSLLGMSMVLKTLHQSPGDTATLSRPLLERIMMSNERQLNLINSLLEDHFNEERQLELHCEPLQLDRLIQNLVTDWNPKLTQNQATLTYSVAPDVPLITADPTQLRRVLDNFFANALTHNPLGLNLILQITVKEQMILCSLQDNGVGISPEQQNSLFRLYIRGFHTQHLTGIGLGLYQCRQIINAHGG
ncbi:MAG TPA: histidine kinase, partial [Cyanobacteria bacterium UBA8553]|nr:histidine kinase [Cyanobacteria bacterium UBA8553]